MSGTYQGLRLAAHVKAPPADDMPDGEIEPQDGDESKKPKSKKKDKPMTDDEIKAMVATAKAEGAAEGEAKAHARTTAVLASEHCEGRKELAVSLLGTSLSAEEIVKQLSVAPKSAAPSAVDPSAAAEAAARAEMASAIDKNKNSDIKVGDGGDKDADPKEQTKAAATAAWAKVYPTK